MARRNRQRRWRLFPARNTVTSTIGSCRFSTLPLVVRLTSSSRTSDAVSRAAVGRRGDREPVSNASIAPTWPPGESLPSRRTFRRCIASSLHRKGNKRNVGGQLLLQVSSARGQSATDLDRSVGRDAG